MGELLGRGGMAEVFAGHVIGSHGFKKPVAIKRLLPELANDHVFVERATEGLIEALLPVLDSFELALSTLDDADEKVRKGVELVYAELLSVLERQGLEKLETDGKPFDPNVHEAVMQEDGDGEPVVTETMRTGYRLKGRVLRPAMVKVTR